MAAVQRTVARPLSGTADTDVGADGAVATRENRMASTPTWAVVGLGPLSPAWTRTEVPERAR